MSDRSVLDRSQQVHVTTRLHLDPSDSRIEPYIPTLTYYGRLAQKHNNLQYSLNGNRLTHDAGTTRPSVLTKTNVKAGRRQGLS
jgi:hypothetical protein